MLRNAAAACMILLLVLIGGDVFLQTSSLGATQPRMAVESFSAVPAEADFEAPPADRVAMAEPEQAQSQMELMPETAAAEEEAAKSMDIIEADDGAGAGTETQTLAIAPADQEEVLTGDDALLGEMPMAVTMTPQATPGIDSAADAAVVAASPAQPSIAEVGEAEGAALARSAAAFSSGPNSAAAIEAPAPVAADAQLAVVEEAATVGIPTEDDGAAMPLDTPSEAGQIEEAMPIEEAAAAEAPAVPRAEQAEATAIPTVAKEDHPNSLSTAGGRCARSVQCGPANCYPLPYCSNLGSRSAIDHSSAKSELATTDTARTCPAHRDPDPALVAQPILCLLTVNRHNRKHRNRAPMPELPEVETYVRELEPELCDQQIRRANVYWERIIAEPSAQEFARAIVGQRFAHFGRRGKFMLIGLAGANTLIVHLRMTGKLQIVPGALQADKHTHVVFDLEDGRSLHYRDPRKFGRMWLVPDPEPVLRRLGPEPLSVNFTPQVLGAKLVGRTASIKALLLDQSIVAGVGNIYADEALYHARIHPALRGGTLEDEEVELLHGAVQMVLQRGIEYRGSSLGGSSLQNYMRPGGAPGGFQEEHRVFRRTGLPCYRCNTPIERITLSQRSTHFCPTCQPIR